MRNCTICKEEKPFTEFRRNARFSTGYEAQCKECRKKKEAIRASDPKSHKIILEGRKRYRERNRERIREQDREAYMKNPDKFRAKARISQKKYFQTEKGRLKYKLENLKLRERYPEKARARSLLSNAVCEGRIIRPDKCSLCFSRDGVIQGHHHDYSKPLDVIWVCKSCHILVHKRIKHRRERLNPETPKGDVIVQPIDESNREESEAVLPPDGYI